MPNFSGRVGVHVPSYHCSLAWTVQGSPLPCLIDVEHRRTNLELVLGPSFSFRNLMSSEFGHDLWTKGSAKQRGWNRNRVFLLASRLRRVRFPWGPLPPARQNPSHIAGRVSGKRTRPRWPTSIEAQRLEIPLTTPSLRSAFIPPVSFMRHLVQGPVRSWISLAWGVQLETLLHLEEFQFSSKAKKWSLMSP